MTHKPRIFNPGYLPGTRCKVKGETLWGELRYVGPHPLVRGVGVFLDTNPGEYDGEYVEFYFHVIEEVEDNA